MPIAFCSAQMLGLGVSASESFINHKKFWFAGSELC
ncbi:protein of unknown function (plasmid) [Azospirillum lipoferum 4B]|uniref:Uncharacterized protein n=1 Tax=Azospirillum lipoferum (strain 4B) TaxID=862719 RepID=G7ZFR4_AZOL4|nr:protein of unknown function [Azospirillum lipoferum 4B]